MGVMPDLSSREGVLQALKNATTAEELEEAIQVLLLLLNRFDRALSCSKFCKGMFLTQRLPSCVQASKAFPATRDARKEAKKRKLLGAAQDEAQSEGPLTFTLIKWSR
jgi:hypothetical protein